MSQLLASLPLFLSILHLTTATGCKGCLTLDEYNFQKVLSKFKVVLVKFDVAYPYGEKHDAFTKFAEEVVANDELTLAEIGVKDYGDKENEQLAGKFGITKDDLPALRLFVKSKVGPTGFDKDEEWTVDNVRNFVRDNTEIYLGLPGCLEDFDKLAQKFVKSDTKEKQITKAEEKLNNLDDKQKETGNIYLKFMQKIAKNGVDFVGQEMKRLTKIVKDGKVNDKKKLELSNRMNILRSFSIRDEL